MRTLPVLLLSFALPLNLAAADLAPYLVKDINPAFTAGSSDPQAFVQLGNVAVFQVWKLGHRELWRSDGTAAGTYRLEEVGYTEILGVGGGRCFFRFQDVDNRWYLQVTDGTLPGTVSLGQTIGYEQTGFAAWVPRQGLLYFASQIPGDGHGTELWRSDGTPGGTYEVADIEPGPGSSNPAYLTSFKGKLYFSATDSIHGSALWQSDGTAAGTRMVREVPADVLNVVGSRLAFLGRDAAYGRELWSSDGTTAGTRRISDLAKGGASPVFHDLEVVGKRLYAVATASAAKGQELYVTDGTAKGTAKLTAFADPYALGQLTQSSLGDRLLFAADDRTHGVELWTSDGTAKGTRMVLDACPGACPSYPIALLRHHGRLYYQATDGTHGFELWVTDGTAQGTGMVADLCPGVCGSWPSALPSPGDRFLFTSRDDTSGLTTLWATDGTAGGTEPLASFPDIYVQGTAVGGALIFSGADPDHGRELWISDGTPEGTHLLADVADEDVGGSDPAGLMPLGERLLFFARDGGGSALWKSDGTDAGTVAVKRGLSGRGPWTASASRAYFQANPRQGSFELWASDGTEAGTVRVTPDEARSLGELSAPVLKLGSRVFFSAWSADRGVEPWVTDGTRAGTRLLADLRPGPAPSSPRDFTVLQGRAWFVARFRLWKSDGTTAGTVALGPELRDMHPWTTLGSRLLFTGRNSRQRLELWSTDGTAARTVRLAEMEAISSPTLHGGRLWFVVDGTEIWSTDGTAGNTRRVNLPLGSSEPYLIVSDGARLYLGLRLYTGSSTVYEIWAGDGTASGTKKIAGLSFYGPWAAFNGRLYFASDSGALYSSDGTEDGTRLVRSDNGPERITRLLRFSNRLLAFTNEGEMWQTDGTAAGTKLIRDLSPMSWYDSSRVMKAGPRLFFPAFDPETGWELWAMRE